MGLFNNYAKPGPGVEKNAPKKPAFFRFFEIFFRKFMHYIKSNLLYLLFSIPTAVISLILISFMLNNLTGGIFSNITERTVALGYLGFSGIILNFYISLFGMGPATAGETYVMRNFSQEEHSWIWSDFIDNIKSNFKQAITVFLIDILLLFVSTVAIVFYAQMSGILKWLRVVMYWILIIYAMMHLYIYPMMVTFELKLKDIFRNAFLFALGNLFKNILVIFLLAVIHIGIPIAILMLGGKLVLILLLVYLLFEILFLHAMSLMLVNFTIFPLIKKAMIDSKSEGDAAGGSDSI